MSDFRNLFGGPRVFPGGADLCGLVDYFGEFPLNKLVEVGAVASVSEQLTFREVGNGDFVHKLTGRIFLELAAASQEGHRKILAPQQLTNYECEAEKNRGLP